MLLLVPLLSAVLCRGQEDFVTVETPSAGSVRGAVLRSVGVGVEYHAFTSVPFAKPPVGELRFQDPQPLDPKDASEVVDATQMPPFCPQYSTNNQEGVQKEPLRGQEDCLYLNVYVPREAATGGGLPVMYWVHGGGFTVGGGTPDFYGADYFMEAELPVVLVTVNYRLSVFGFLSTESEAIPGNAGIKDQVAGLEWVRDNIASFGGDPSRVTLFGESAGGLSAMYHYVSPRSAGLFHRVISQSGPFLGFAMAEFNKRPRDYAKILAKDARCDLDDEDGERCLVEAPMKDLMAAARKFEQYTYFPLPFKPVVDPWAKEPFMPLTKEDYVIKKEFSNVPLMIGANSAEGAIITAQFVSTPAKMKRLAENLRTDLPMMLQNRDGEEVDDRTYKEAVDFLDWYTGRGDAFDLAAIPDATRMFGDVMFLAPNDITVRELAARTKSPVYYYMYNFRGQHFFPTYYHGYNASNGDLGGVSHADDVLIMFKFPGADLTDHPPDQIMSKKMIKMWTKFAYGREPDERWQPVQRSPDNPNGSVSLAMLDLWPVRMVEVTEATWPGILRASDFLRNMWKSWERSKDEL